MNSLSKTILFGGSGFLGPIILERYPEIISVGRTKPPPEVKNRHIHFESLDDLRVLDELDFDKVIFLIGNSNHHQINQSSMMGLDYNVIPIKKALHYLKRGKLKKFIAFTTILLYDVNKLKLPVDESQPVDPYLNDYVFSKYLQEEVMKFYKEVPSIAVRLSNIYGPTRLLRPDLVPTLMQSVLSSKETEVWSIKPERDLIYAKDAADAVVALLDTDFTGHINLGTGKSHSIGEVVEIIEKISGKKIKVLDIPVSGPMKFITNISLISKLTGWKPKYSLEEGLQETYQIMKMLK